MNHRLKLASVGVLIIGLVIGLAAVFFGAQIEREKEGASATESSMPVSVEFQGVYETLTREEMIDQADLIFVGQVVNVSPARWNQDSGEYWDDDDTPDLYDSALPYHETDVAVLQPIVDTIGLGEKAVITVLGNSPVGPDPEVPGLKVEGQPVKVVVADSPAHDLKVGDQVVVFARRTEIAWREGTRSALLFAGSPRDSYLIRRPDGLYHYWRPELEKPVSLEELIAQIGQRREISVQP